MNKDTITIKPIITERSMDAVSRGKFTFQVGRFANKRDIKRLIEKQFRVNVVSVATRIVKGKTQRVGIRRVEVKKSPWKKAIVKLAPGEKIDLFETGAKA